MSEPQIVRPRLQFEREYGQHRNWWVRGSDLTGNAVKVLLHLLSHDQTRPISQTEARKQIGFGESAWRAAKTNLMRHGFLIEIRDRYPQHSRRSNGEPCGGQKRFRIVLQDPEEGTVIALEDAIIESNEPVILDGEIPDQSQSRKSRVDAEATLENQEWLGKPQVRASLEDQEWSSTTLENQESFIGREKDLDLDLELNNSGQVNAVTTREAEAGPVVEPGYTETERCEIDLGLTVLHPKLTVAAIERHVAGRVRLADFDLVWVARQILEANRKPGGVRQPAAYVAKALVSQPEKWAESGAPYVSAVTAYGGDPGSNSDRDRGSVSASNECPPHDWGPALWQEFERSACVACGRTRREVDPEWAALEAAEFDRRF